jgi:hypothetical protein
VELEDGEGQIITLAKDKIIDVELIDPDAGADTYFQDAAGNKMILMPVGFGMEPGEFHVADQELVVVSASYGFSEHFSVWGALSIPGMLVNARYSFSPSERIGISVGSFATVIFIDIESTVLLPYVIASFGTLHQNFTIGLAVPFFTSSIISYDYMVTGGILAVGGKIVLSSAASIVTENWIGALCSSSNGGSAFTFDGVYIVPSIAFRVAGSRFSWDIGITMPFVYTPQEEWNYSVDPPVRTTGTFGLQWLMGDPIPLPIVGITYRIN